MGEATEADEPTTLNPDSWVDEYGDYLYRYALSRLRDPEASEEVVQQTFLAALQHLEQFSGRGSERAWLLGILKRKIVDLIRQRSRTSQLTEEEGRDPLDRMFDRRGNWKPEIRSTLLQPLDSLEREEFWPVLRRCMDGLPVRQADVFMLREMDELETAEICKELAITPSNLWVLLHRARLRLSSCMKRRWNRDNG